MAWNRWRGTSPRPANDVSLRQAGALRRAAVQPRRAPSRGRGARARIGAGA